MNQENGDTDGEAANLAVKLCDFFEERNISPYLALKVIEIFAGSMVERLEKDSGEAMLENHLTEIRLRYVISGGVSGK